MFIAGAAVLAAVLCAGCSIPPKRPLVAGYYSLGDDADGFAERLIVYQGERRLSYDVWRVSPDGDGTSKHAHFDLIASDDVPSSGQFEVTQDGSDCGTMWVEPYRDKDGVHDEILILTYDGQWVPVGSGAIRDRPAPEQYADVDKASEWGIAQIAARHPNLYASMTGKQRAAYAASEPQCRED